MTKDVIALTPTMPDLRTLLAGLYAGGPDLGVQTLADGAVVQLCAPGGRTLVSVEAPVLVQVPGETARLLDRTVPDGLTWWTEVRATTAVPEAGALAGSFAGRLATVLGGTVWPPEAASTDVVPLSSEVAAVAAPAARPAVDVLTPTTAVVIQDRPLVAATSWLSDALRTAADADHALQIVTPPTTRLTLPTRTALRGLPNRWVVQDPEHGYYDGLSGAVLHWKNGTFTPVDDASVAPAFTTAATTDTGERQLLLTLRTAHPAGTDLMLGRALEAAWRHLTGAPPAGWSTAEPVNLPWSTRQLTDLARSRAPRPTWLVAVGHPERPAIATVRVLRTPKGVEEDIALAIGYGPDEEPPVAAIENLAAELAAEHGLVTLLTSLRTARRDLTVPPHLESPPVPVTFTVVGDPPTTGPTPLRLGRALHYRLGDGSRAEEGWGRLRELLDQVRVTTP